MDLKALEEAGKIAAEIKREVKKIVRPGEKLLEVAEWIEGKIRDEGAFPAFPVNISINDVAAHYSPWPGDRMVFKEGEVVKIDFGLHIDGWPVDTAFTVDLGEHDELLRAAEDALKSALEVLRERGAETTLSEVGRAIENAIRGRGFLPITNLTGHQMNRWILHAGRSIYNYDCGSREKLGYGIFAIEPFATDGFGKVKEGEKSSIYRLLSPKPQRLPQLRKLLGEIKKFRTFPFSARWVSSPAYLPLLVKQGVLHNYPLLIEVKGGVVSQFEETVLIGERVKILTR